MPQVDHKLPRHKCVQAGHECGSRLKVADTGVGPPRKCPACSPTPFNIYPRVTPQLAIGLKRLQHASPDGCSWVPTVAE